MLKQTAELVDSQVPRASIETRPEENFGGVKDDNHEGDDHEEDDVEDDDNDVDDDNLKPGQTRTSEV